MGAKTDLLRSQVSESLEKLNALSKIAVDIKVNGASIRNATDKIDKTITAMSAQTTAIEEKGKKTGKHAKSADANIQLSIALTSILESTNYIIMAVESGNSNPLATSAYSLQSVSAMFGMVGLIPGCGPLALVVSAVLGITASILSAFGGGEPERSLEDKIEELLVKHQNIKALNDLKAAAKLINGAHLVLGSTNEKYSFENILQYYDFLNGIGVYTLASGEIWLKEPKNQQLETWEDLLDIYISVIGSHLRLLTEIGTNHLINDIVDDPDSDVVQRSNNTTKLLTLSWASYQELSTLWNDLASVVANRGAAWHIGDYRVLYERDHVIGNGEYWSGWRKIGGESEIFVVSERSERLWTLEGYGNRRCAANGRQYPFDGKMWTAPAGSDHFNIIESLKGVVDFSLCPSPLENVDTLLALKPSGSLSIFKWNEISKTTSSVATIENIKDVTAVYQARIALVFPTDPSNTQAPPEMIYRVYTLSEIKNAMQIFAYDFNKEGVANVSEPMLISLPHAGIIGISCNTDYLVVYSKSDVWLMSHAKRGAKTHPAWRKIEDRDNGFPGDILDAFITSDDCIVLAVGSGETGRLLFWNEISKQWSYGNDRDGAASKIVKHPLAESGRFSAMHRSIKSRLNDFKTSDEYAWLRVHLKEMNLLDENMHLTVVNSNK